MERNNQRLSDAIIDHIATCLAHGSEPFTIDDDLGDILYSSGSPGETWANIGRNIQPNQDEIDAAVLVAARLMV